MSSNGTSSTLLPSFSPPPSPSQQTQPPLPSVTPPAVPSAGPSPPPSSPSNPSRPADPPSSAPPASPSPAPSSNPPSPPPSSNPPSPSSRPPSSTPPASSPPASETRTVTAPSATPSATDVQTSVIFITPSQSVPGQTSVIIITTVLPPNSASRPTNSLPNTGSPSSTNPTQLQGAGKVESSGLSTGGKTAIAVVIPVVAVALLVLGAILFWRKRKQRKNNEDERRKEVEEYGFNPNHDPTLPAVGTAAVMTEDSSGYRGWGNTQTSSNRMASTTLTSGMTYSDSNSNPGGYASPHSPTNAYSDGASNDPLMNGRRETMDSDGIGALGAAPTANNSAGVHRGPSNASSSYSAGNRSDNSGEYPGMPTHNPQDYYDQGYYQEGPYGGNNAYGGGQQPIIRDVSARRNTRIENPSVFPQQGNSGVSTNF